KRSRPAGVVLDLLMPRLGGLDALKRIRTFDPAIRIVVITGSPDPELVRQAKALGAVAVLTKPISPPDLLAPLHAAAAPAPAASALPTRTPSARSAAAGATATAEILVVAGEPELRARLEGLLTAAGHRVRLTGDAASGVRAVVERRGRGAAGGRGGGRAGPRARRAPLAPGPAPARPRPPRGGREARGRWRRGGGGGGRPLPGPRPDFEEVPG